MKKYQVLFTITKKFEKEFEKFMNKLFEVNKNSSFVLDRKNDEELWKESTVHCGKGYLIETYLSNEEYEAVKNLEFILISVAKTY